MGWSRNPIVRQMREDFQTCPGCFRTRQQIWDQRPHPEMQMNQCLTIEHLHARSHGGTNHHSNLIIICHRCNFTRGSQTPWDWFGEQNGIYSQGWPCPQLFHGRAGRINRQIWEGRAQAIACLLGHGTGEHHPTWNHGPAY